MVTIRDPLGDVGIARQKIGEKVSVRASAVALFREKIP